VSASAQVESTGNSAANAANWRGFAAWLAKRAAAGKFSGAVLIARDGKPVVKQANGFADRQRKRPNTVDTKFKEPLQFQPGSRFGYSNSGYVALGAIIEAVTGQNYYDYVREHVFKPARMKQTGWYSPGQVPTWHTATRRSIRAALGSLGTRPVACIRRSATSSGLPRP
jgi:CubicO group peptidase (beta-lactamase class C family)